jgi:hypothetical protein
LTSGRSPLPIGNVTPSSASALTEPKPVASAAMPARFNISRLSSIVLPPKLFVEAGLHRTQVAQVSRRRTPSQFMLWERGQGAAAQQSSRLASAADRAKPNRRNDKTPAALGDRGLLN